MMMSTIFPIQRGVKLEEGVYHKNYHHHLRLKFLCISSSCLTMIDCAAVSTGDQSFSRLAAILEPK